MEVRLAICMATRPLIPTILALAVLAWPGGESHASSGKICLIVNEANPIVSITRKQVSDLFSRETEHFPNGMPAEPVELTLSLEPAETFYQAVMGKNLSQVRRHRARIIFEKNVQPPRQMDSGATMIQFVLQNPDALGFVTEEEAGAKGVKILPMDGESCW